MLRFLVGMLFSCDAVYFCRVLSVPSRPMPRRSFSPCTPADPSPTSAECDPVNAANPLPVSLSSQYPTGSTAITGNATGTTGAVVGTLAGTSGKNDLYLRHERIGYWRHRCGWPDHCCQHHHRIDGVRAELRACRAAISARIVLSCIPATGTNTSITTTTSPLTSTASNVAVNRSWGYNK